MATTIYEVKLNDLKDYYSDNAIMTYLLNDIGFKTFDIDKNYPGSLVEGDTLYLLITDYNPITVDGEEIEIIEDIMYDFSIETLRDNGFIRPADDTVIKRNLSKYELSYNFDLDDVLTDLVQSDGYMFIEILKEAYDMDLLDAYI